MAAGYFALGIRSMPTFYAGLALLCFGNGFFKPNISAMVGNLYAPDDPRRDAGFNIFYMGINIGATISALLAAPLRNLWSFNMAFTAAGVGMLIGVAILVINWKKLADGRPPDRAQRRGRFRLEAGLPDHPAAGRRSSGSSATSWATRSPSSRTPSAR